MQQQLKETPRLRFRDVVPSLTSSSADRWLLPEFDSPPALVPRKPSWELNLFALKSGSTVSPPPRSKLDRSELKPPLVRLRIDFYCSLILLRLLSNFVLDYNTCFTFGNKLRPTRYVCWLWSYHLIWYSNCRWRRWGRSYTFEISTRE